MKFSDLSIDPGAPTPPYEQLRAQIADGGLAPGTKLPTVRALADELGLAPNTVARAYRELETAGVIETRGRSGSFVALSRDAGEHALQEAAAAYAARARSLGIDPTRAVSYVEAALSSAH
ncbi:MAG: GntR family transcriptional regulator [Pseudolysinimonas sp.]